MAEWCTVTGRFMSQQEQGESPWPLSGRVVFQARTHARGDATLYGASPRAGYVVDGLLCEDPAGTSPKVRLLAPSEGVPLEVAVEVTPEQLREQLLDCQIAAGAISLQDKTEDTEGA